MTAAIDITAGQRKTLLALLRRYIPGVAVWAYGSRVKWTARPNSDLDLVAFTTPEQQPVVSELKEALAESDLPFLVDLHVWDDVPERFHEIIRKEYVVLQETRHLEKGSAMVSGWPEVTLQYAFEINPRREAKRGTVTPFVPMDALPEHAREIARIDAREFTGSGTRFKNGDTLLARITPCLENGKTAYVSGLEGDTVAHGSTEYIVIAGKQNVSDGLFAYYLVRSPEFRTFAIGHMEGTSGRQRVPTDAVAKFRFSLPLLAEQKAIAQILGTLDDKIELNRRMNATLEAMARALFQSWFVDFDPVRAKLDGRQPTGLDAATAALFPDHFQVAPLGHIPQGWEVSSIYEVASVIYGAPFASSLFNAEKLGKPLIRIRDLPNESPAVFTTEVHPKGYLLKAGDIAVGMDGEFRAYLWAGVESWLNQRVCVFAPKPSFSAAFVRNSIIAPLAEVEATETATTVIHLGKNDIERFKVIVPEAPVIEAFTKVCQPWYDQIVANKQQSRTLAILRDTLLPKLLSGELSVAGAEQTEGRIA